MESVYIFSSGHLKRKGNTLVFETEEGKKHLPVENVSEIRIFGEVSLNKRLLEFLTQKGIMVHFFNHFGFYIGSYYPRESNQSGMVTLQQANHYLDKEKRLEIARRIVEGALYNIMSTLKSQRSKDLEKIIENIAILKDKSQEARTIGELMAYEGNAREIYYNAFNIILKNEKFRFTKREKRPPTNYINTLISFGNSLLYTTALSEIFRTHLDPRIGYLHETNQRRFSLNLDIAEIFKPIIVDRVIFRLVNRSQIKEEHFSKIVGGLKLNDRGKRIFAKEYEARLKETISHSRLKRKVSFRTLIRLEAYKLEKHVLSVASYQPYHHSY
ncbi:MAG: type I-B CRISPR-associated endonuclease Cas1 [Thermotogae bacterium]|nr:type I-B CRISPR-associated endonuclease Cas1 [Thermotogota bacterium]